MFAHAVAAVDGALAAGAAYADARVVIAIQESIDVLNRSVESMDHTETAGVGVRALIGSSWGFYATAELTEAAARRAGEMAAAIARASTTVAGPPLQLADVPIVVDGYETPHEEHPLEVPLSEKVDLVHAPSIRLQRWNFTGGAAG